MLWGHENTHEALNTHEDVHHTTHAQLVPVLVRASDPLCASQRHSALSSPARSESGAQEMTGGALTARAALHAIDKAEQQHAQLHVRSCLRSMGGSRADVLLSSSALDSRDRASSALGAVSLQERMMRARNDNLGASLVSQSASASMDAHDAERADKLLPLASAPSTAKAAKSQRLSLPHGKHGKHVISFEAAFGLL